MSLYRDDRGIDFARAAIASALGKGSAGESIMHAEHLFGAHSAAAHLVKAIASGALAERATVGGTTPASPGWGAELADEARRAATEFWEYVRQRTVIGRIGAREAPLHAPFISAAAGTSAGWVTERDETPLTDMDFSRSRLPARKVGAIAVVTNELANLSQVERLVRDDLANALAAAIDEAFVSDDAAVGEQIPAGIANGAIDVPSTGELGYDIAALVDAFPGDPTRAAFIGSPFLFARLDRRSYPGVGLSDGELLLRPAYVSGNAAPSDDSPAAYDLLMVSPGDIALAEGLPEVQGSREGNVKINGHMRSLWQDNLLGVRATQFVNWAPQRPAVARLTGIII